MEYEDKYIMKKLNRNEMVLLFRRMFLMAFDILAIGASGLLALWMRYEFDFEKIDYRFLNSMWHYLPVNIILTLLIFYLFKLYHSMWTYAGVTELQNVVSAGLVSVFIQFLGLSILGYPMTRSYHFIYAGILISLTGGSRFIYRLTRMTQKRKRKKELCSNVMLIGAGEAANAILKETLYSNYVMKIVKCIIDDAPEKQGRFLQGVKVVGGRNTIIENCIKYEIDEIIIAIPSASRKVISELVTICKETNCKMKILPGMYQLMNDEISVTKLRDVEVEDLLGRDPILVDLDSIMDYVSNKVVLVTGGGGSIGSELCRQIAAHKPKQLIILDIYENTVYNIQLELKRKYPDLNLEVLIASVRNTNRINQIFEKYRPQLVYHAAAHKHVPLMEDSPNEAIKNNVFGTLKTVKAADRYGAERFVMISTDKAVNPTNVMGASKRICEMIIQMYNNKSKTEFVAVRFGNVLGSNGSVIPLFKKQIQEGGPVTVTHPDIIRYFMTIPEAVSLVLQAGAYAKGGEIFVLDMGEPVKILDLATNLIRLSGYKPNEDIKIEFTGLRPGEKLYEELLMEEEGMQETENKMIHIGKPIEMDEEKFERELEALSIAAKKEKPDMRQMIQKIVPTYKPDKLQKKKG